MDPVLLPMFVDDLVALDVTPPTAAIEALDLLNAARAVAAEHPSDDLRAALEAGEIDAANVAERVRAAAIALTAKQSIHTLARDLERPIYRRVR